MGESLASMESMSEKDLVSSFFSDSSPGSVGYLMQIVLRALFHLKPFTVPFMKLTKDEHDHYSGCVFCPMVALFKKMQLVTISEVEEGFVDSELQEKMSKDLFNFTKSAKEKVKDVSSAFVLLIDELNKSVGINTFTITTTDAWICRNEKCKHRKDSNLKKSLHWKINGKQLIHESQTHSGKKKMVFEELVKRVSDGQNTHCPKCKGKKFTFRKWVVELPYVVTLSIQWDLKDTFGAFKKKKVHKMMAKLLATISPVILVGMFFRTHSIKNVDSLAARLCAIICLRNGTYVAYFYNHLIGSWFFIDDDEITPLKKKWKVVAKHMLDNNSFPSLMFYEIVKRKHDVIKVIEG